MGENTAESRRAPCLIYNFLLRVLALLDLVVSDESERVIAEHSCFQLCHHTADPQAVHDFRLLCRQDCCGAARHHKSSGCGPSQPSPIGTVSSQNFLWRTKALRESRKIALDYAWRLQLKLANEGGCKDRVTPARRGKVRVFLLGMVNSLINKSSTMSVNIVSTYLSS